MNDDIDKIAEQISQAAQCLIDNLIPLFKTLVESLWELYRAAGSPYGDTDEGLIRWLEQYSQG